MIHGALGIKFAITVVMTPKTNKEGNTLGWLGSAPTRGISTYELSKFTTFYDGALPTLLRQPRDRQSKIDNSYNCLWVFLSWMFSFPVC